MYKVGQYVKLTSLHAEHYLEGTIVKVYTNKAPCDFTICVEVAKSCKMYKVGKTADIITAFYEVEIV